MMSDRPHALVTGGSRGIGLALARTFARNGHDLVLTARSADDLAARAAELREAHGVRVRFIAGDLAEPDAPARIHHELREAGIAVDFLVNNAGFGGHGRFHEQKLDRQLAMIRVNVEALVHLTGLFLPDMIRQGRGGVLQVASTAGFQPGPYMSVYYATKAFVLHFSEGLAEEVRGEGVSVTALCAGPVRTSFQTRAGMTRAPLGRGVIPILTAEQAAEAGYTGLMRGKSVVVPGLVNKLGATLMQLTPRALVRKVVGRANAGR